VRLGETGKVTALGALGGNIWWFALTAGSEQGGGSD
jgi:hypothetical protein